MKKLLSSIIAIVTSFFVVITPATPAMATTQNFAVETAILEECGDRDGSDSIICLLRTAVDILSVGIGILAVIGITIVGIQYLTAGGNEEQTRKAKRRLFEIVIGIVAYVVIYALLQWLLPTFNQTS